MFLNLYSQHITLGLPLHSSFLSTFRFTAVMAFSSNTESNSPKQCLCFKHFNTSVLSRESQPLSTETVPTWENLLCITFWHFCTSLRELHPLLWHSSVPPPAALLAAETAGRDHSLLSDGYFSRRNRSTAALTWNNQNGNLLSHVIL